MMTIRKRNLAVIEAAFEKGMNVRLVKYTMTRFPHIFGDDKEKAQENVDRAYKIAAEYGIHKGVDVALFTDLLVMYGDNFHQDPWAREVLMSETLSPREKVFELRLRVRDSGALI
jgi:hypothetical protein